MITAQPYLLRFHMNVLCVNDMSRFISYNTINNQDYDSLPGISYPVI